LGKTPHDTNEEEPRKKTIVIEYSHGIGHRLKKVGALFDLNVVFSFPHKLRNLPASINAKQEPCKKAVSTHTEFVTCKKKVVYNLPLTCNKSYIGQTGRCVNERIIEHIRGLKRTTKGDYKTLNAHIDICGCKPLPESTSIMGCSGRNQLARELQEAFWIRQKEDTAVSEPSIILTDKEFHLLQKYQTIQDERYH